MIGLLAYLAIVAAVAALFLVFPGIDLWASGLFYRAGDGFFLRDTLAMQAVYRLVPFVTEGVVLLVLVASLWWLFRGSPLLGLERRKMAFLVLALALGPGLLVNTVLKDHWGRARPSQVVEFGGEKQFTPAPLPARQCDHNCSFVGGHAAIGFYLVAFAFLVPERRRRRIAEAAALAAGGLIGVVRIAQGGHFLSDIVWAGVLVWGLTWLLYWWVVERDGLAAPPMRRLYAAAARLPGMTLAVVGRPGGRLGLWSAATAIVIAVCVLHVDKPLALRVHELDPGIHRLFADIARLGVATGYLVGAALLFAGLRLAARNPGLAAWRERLVAWSYLPGFVFVAMAASGLTVNILKAVFGRARPKLLFSGGEDYYFGFFGMQADYWSFPSGHAVTIVAFVAALYRLWPRHLAAYVLVAGVIALSRVVIAAHYLSDVVMAAYIAVVMTAYVALVFERSGIDLDAAKAGRLRPVSPPPWRVRLGLARERRGDRPEEVGASAAATDSP
jgi:lipid A 4'-phosphatase